MRFTLCWCKCEVEILRGPKARTMIITIEERNTQMSDRFTFSALGVFLLWEKGTAALVTCKWRLRLHSATRRPIAPSPSDLGASGLAQSCLMTSSWVTVTSSIAILSLFSFFCCFDILQQASFLLVAPTLFFSSSSLVFFYLRESYRKALLLTSSDTTMKSSW